MVSKLEALRRGDAVEIEDGIVGRLNSQNKTMEMSDGRILRIGDDPDYFPRDESERRASLESEKLEREISSFPLGQTAGEFAYQFGQKGAVTGGLGDWVDRLTNTGETYLAKKQAKEQVGSRISQESPYMSMGATAASFVPDIAATSGMSAVKAVPLLTTAAAGSRVLDEPGQVAGEAAVGAGAGFLLDKATRFLGKTAARRAASRDIARETEAIQARNIIRQGEVEAENIAGQEAFQREKQFLERENQARQHQFNLEKVARENEMIGAKNAFEEAKAANSLEKDALKQEYQAAQDRYRQAVDQLPKEQQAAQRQLSQRNAKYYDSVTEQLPADGTINTTALRAEEFIDQSIRKSAAATSSEGREASKIIRSLFEEGEEIGGKELSRRLRVLDEIIETSPRETQLLLDQFKRSMNRNVSQEIANELAYRKAAPAILGSIKADLKAAFSGFKADASLGMSKNEMMRAAQESIETTLSQMPRQEFLGKVRSGEIIDDLVQKALPKDRFARINIEPEALKLLEKQGMTPLLTESVEYRSMIGQHEGLVSRLAESLENRIAAAEAEASQIATKSRRLTSRRFREAYGVADPLPAPQAPVEPVYPGAPTAPPTPQQIPPAVSAGSPTPQAVQSFTPEAAPVLGAPTGASEKMGDFLDKPIGSLIRKSIGRGSIGKLASLNYLFGHSGLSKGLVPGLGYGLLKGITSPTAAGNIMRQTIQKGGMRILVDQISESYPSYENGVLQNPQERKHAVAQIESNPDIPIEDKAMLQAYINRGKSIENLSRY